MTNRMRGGKWAELGPPSLHFSASFGIEPKGKQRIQSKAEEVQRSFKYFYCALINSSNITFFVVDTRNVTTVEDWECRFT